MVEMHYIPTTVMTWLEENMGNSHEGRWFIRTPNIYFYNEIDHMMFLVRWA
jgi:hypothetical protein